MLRQQLPVYSPIRASALIPGLRSAFTRNRAHHGGIVAFLAAKFGGRSVVLTDSGTSALVLALRSVVGEGGVVAFPAYACVDLAAAALYAQVKVRLYDIDPTTLSPDLDSVSRVLKQGVAAIVVAHLYGIPADVLDVADLARTHGVSVIEDAAQGAGGMLRGVPLGSFGPLTVLSFSRGKGVTGGYGGALLGITLDSAEGLESMARSGPVRAGWRELLIVATQYAFGRPALYWIPSAIPGLRLGEMVFHPAHEPRALSAAAAAVVSSALSQADRETAIRRRNAEMLMAAVESADGLGPIHPVSGGTPGYLRFPVRDLRQRAEVRRLGILRGYPRTLTEQEELRPCLMHNETAPAGAAELKRSLFTLPVHSLITRRDMQQLTAWLRSPSAVSAGRPG
jgi:dTDP-4-amino-4,6-dideoxygalactose transaminase